MSSLHIKTGVAPQKTGTCTLQDALAEFASLPSAVSCQDEDGNTRVMQVIEDAVSLSTMAIDLQEPAIHEADLFYVQAGSVSPLHLAQIVVALDKAPQLEMAIPGIVKGL